MRKILFSIVTLMCFAHTATAQSAVASVPLGIGRNNCAGNSGQFRASNDSLYYFNYVSPNLTNYPPTPTGCQPILKPRPYYGSNNYPFMVFDASIAFNPKDQMIYYVWTDYGTVSSPIDTSYIWRWAPGSCPMPAGGLDTIKSFPTDIGGLTFDPNGLAWQLEFGGLASNTTTPHPVYIRSIDFATGTIGTPDTLDLTFGSIYNVGTGDITLTPSGQMYFVFDNKLYTPDYTSYGGATHHIKCTYIDTVRKPSGTSGLPGLAFGYGDLIASYSPGCTYRRIDPVTGDTNFVNYGGYASGKGVGSFDMTAINSGVGASKKLVSLIPTGTPNQYDVTYDIYVKNYGNVPVTNVQVKDSLAGINGIGNLSNVSASFLSNPAGMVLNPGFNGSTNINLLTGTVTLPNYPVANNNFTIRVSCRISGVLPGVTYNNSAIASGNGYNNVALRDSSTDGNAPDLNENDKPDDVGEGQPTPFIVLITPIVPPCGTLNQTLYNEDFGTGVGMSATYPATSITNYGGVSVPALAINKFTITDSAQRGDPANWIKLRDHTGNTNGRMLEINADAAPGVMFRDTMPVSCPGQQYSFSFWTAFIGNSSYKTVCDGIGTPPGFRYPRFTVRVKPLGSPLVITQFTSDSIASNTWVQRGMKWVMPTGYTNIIIEIINAGQGGCGNDVVIDDIQYGICDPQPVATVNNTSGCIGGTATFTGSLTDTTQVPGPKDYQWQWSPAPGAGPWTNIGGATSVTYTINPVNPTDTGRYYRVLIAAQGNMAITTCRYTSPGIQLVGKVPSTPPTSATRNKNNICPGKIVQLTAAGGTLGTGAKYYWYTGSCGGTLIDSGAVINVTPSVTTTYYVLIRGTCNTTSCAQVTVAISCDIDKDDDGIPDFVESNMPAALLDANTNGIQDAFDPAIPGYKDNNNDYINDDYQADGDSDADGIPNYLDATFPGRVDTNLDGVDDRFDTDKDGIINMLDLDSDNDGVPDVVEQYGVDVNGDGKIDNYTDTDGDGFSQNVDGNITGPNVSGAGLGLVDFDGDGVPNFLDLDSDNDGIPDAVESGAPDVNNDGKADGFVDVNGDGLNDNYINATGLLKTGVDANNNGRADSWPNKNMDQDLRPNAYDLDADGDGVADVIEAGFPDTDFNGIVDYSGAIPANGWATVISSRVSLGLRSTDADGKPDYLDIDSDNDGIPDNIEGQTTAGYKLPGTTDTDGDGIVDTYDIVAGFGGSGIFLIDTDGDSTPDVRDLDTDSDGQPDIVEGNDFNLNGSADDLVTLTGLDADGDGLDNRFDSLTSTTNLKGTSYMMGNSGSTSGDPVPGTRSPVQKKVPAQTDRDWRYVGTVLPVQFLNFTGVALANTVKLNWTIITPQAIDHFEIERSVDNTTYTKTGTVQQPVKLNEAQTFGFDDDITAVSSNIIYYKLKVVAKTGEIKYSNVLVVRRSFTKTPVAIMPNPANDYVSVRFFAEKESEVTIRLIDNLGKQVLNQKQKVTKGNNTIQLNGLSRYSNGVYTMQITVNDEITTEKLILSK